MAALHAAWRRSHLLRFGVSWTVLLLAVSTMVLGDLLYLLDLYHMELFWWNRFSIAASHMLSCFTMALFVTIKN